MSLVAKGLLDVSGRNHEDYTNADLEAKEKFRSTCDNFVAVSWHWASEVLVSLARQERTQVLSVVVD